MKHMGAYRNCVEKKTFVTVLWWWLDSESVVNIRECMHDVGGCHNSNYTYNAGNRFVRTTHNDSECYLFKFLHTHTQS